MSCCDEKDYCIGSGETFHPTIRWGQATLASVPVTGITNATPAVITAPGHQVPNGWPVALVGVSGMTQINAAHYPPRSTEFNQATVLDANTVSLDSVSSNAFGAYLSGGDLVYNEPVNLSGMVPKLTVWDTPARNDTPLAVLSLGSGITVDTLAYTISPVLQTAGLPIGPVYYNLDMTDASGIVTRILTGMIQIN